MLLFGMAGQPFAGQWRAWKQAWSICFRTPLTEVKGVNILTLTKNDPDLSRMTKELIVQHLREQGLKITPKGWPLLTYCWKKGASPRSGFGLSGGRKEDEEYQPFFGLRHAERTRAPSRAFKTTK
jgi:hypothetical protein